jgi:hypothetical protein
MGAYSTFSDRYAPFLGQLTMGSDVNILFFGGPKKTTRKHDEWQVVKNISQHSKGLRAAGEAYVAPAQKMPRSILPQPPPVPPASVPPSDTVSHSNKLYLSRRRCGNAAGVGSPTGRSNTGVSNWQSVCWPLVRAVGETVSTPCQNY